MKTVNCISKHPKTGFTKAVAEKNSSAGIHMGPRMSEWSLRAVVGEGKKITLFCKHDVLGRWEYGQQVSGEEWISPAFCCWGHIMGQGGGKAPVKGLKWAARSCVAPLPYCFFHPLYQKWFWTGLNVIRMDILVFLHHNYNRDVFVIFILECISPYLTVAYEILVNPLNAELNPICYLLALLAHHFLHVSRIRVKSLTLRLLMSYIYIYIWSTYSWCF